MEPTYFPNDRVLTFNWIKPKAGDVIVFWDGSRNFIKRVDFIKNSLVRVYGDNKKMSSKFKPINKSQIVGVVILKY